MDIETLVEELKGFVRSSQRAGRGYWLVMLNRDLEILGGQWGLLFSGPWIDKLGRHEALMTLVSDLRRVLSSSALEGTSAINVLRTSDEFVQAFGKNFRLTQPGSLTVRERLVGSFYIHEAILIVCKVKRASLPHSPGRASKA